MDFFKNIIYKKSVKPLKRVTIDDAMILTVEFQNYKVSKKINNDFRMFLITLKDVTIKKISNQPNAIEVRLGYHDVFGICEGDVIEFSSVDFYSFRCIFI